MEICNDTRLVKCQINDAEYYKLRRPFSVMDRYLVPQALLRINWNESKTANAGKLDDGIGTIRYLQFLNIARLSGLFICEMPVIIAEPVPIGLGLRHMKAYHIPTLNQQVDSLDDKMRETLGSIWSRVAQKLEPHELPEKLKIALSSLNAAALRTDSLAALVDLWIAMEFLVSRMAAETFLSAPSLSDLFSIIENGQIRKDSSGVLMTKCEMKNVADRVRNKVNQIDVRERFNSFCSKYAFSPTEDAIQTVWGKGGLRDQRNELEHGRKANVNGAALQVMGDLLRRMLVVALEKEASLQEVYGD
jgi:hypothetical protein